MRQEFLNWYGAFADPNADPAFQSMSWVQFQWALADAYRIGPRLCLAHSAEAAALIPQSYIEDQRWQFAINVRGHGGRSIEHVLLARDTTGHNPGEADVVLMQFGSQDGLDWQWGDCGVAQYWIKREDLAALRFDDVIVTVHGS